MELNKIISQLQLELSAFKFTDDSPLDYEYLKDMLIIANKSVFDEFVRTGLPLDGFYQTVDCIELTCSEGTCVIEGIVFHSGNYSHKASLPPLVKTIGDRNISYLGIFGFDGEINRVSLSEFRSLDGARHTGKNPCYTVIGDEAIFKNIPSAMTVVTLVAILTDCTQACNWPDDDMAEFPTASEYKVKLLVKKDIMSTYPISPDVIDNAQMAINEQKQQRVPEEEKEQQ